MSNIVDCILRILEQDTYEHYGLRVISSRSGRTVKIGDILPPSMVWVDGNITDEELAGAAAIEIHCNNVAKGIARLKGYWGGYVALIAGNYAQRGEDIGEIIITDAEVLAVWAWDAERGKIAE